MTRGWVAGAIVIAMALSGCSGGGGGDDGTTEAKNEPTTSEAAEEPSSPATSPAPSLTLKEICPQIEAALPGGMVPSSAKLQAFIATAEGLQQQGDLEAQNAIPLLLEPIQDLYDVVSAGGRGSELTDALTAELDGISAFANRCKAAGSPALQ